MHKWSVPAAEEQCGRQHRDREHVDVLGQEEQRKLHGAVLGMKTRHQFRFCFRQIKRHAVRFRDRR